MLPHFQPHILKGWISAKSIHVQSYQGTAWEGWTSIHSQKDIKERSEEKQVKCDEKKERIPTKQIYACWQDQDQQREGPFGARHRAHGCDGVRRRNATASSGFPSGNNSSPLEPSKTSPHPHELQRTSQEQHVIQRVKQEHCPSKTRTRSI